MVNLKISAFADEYATELCEQIAGMRKLGISNIEIRGVDGENVSVIFDDILIQAAWCSIRYRLDLFRRYPYLAEAASRARIRTGSDVLIPFQLLAKLVAFFRR